MITKPVPANAVERLLMGLGSSLEPEQHELGPKGLSGYGSVPIRLWPLWGAPFLRVEGVPSCAPGSWVLLASLPDSARRAMSGSHAREACLDLGPCRALIQKTTA